MNFPYRVILYHNNAASARLRFLRFPYQSVCAFEALPRLAMLMDEDEVSSIEIHPAQIVQQVEKKLRMAPGELEAEAEFKAAVDIAGGPVKIFLLRFTSLDAPSHIAEQQQADFIDLPGARNLPQVELELLRKAYELILGG